MSRPMKPVITINNNILNLVCLFIITLILVFGLWPFNLNPSNRVFWLKEGPGIRFTGPGHLYTVGDLAPALASGRTMSLEMVLRPAAEPDNRLPVIVGWWDGRSQEEFLLGQWKNSLAVRVRTSRPDVPRGYRERGKSRALLKDRPVFLTLTSSPEGTRLYADGIKAADWPGFPLLEDGPAGRAILVLGNSAAGQNHWEGDLLGLALYDRVLMDREVRENHSRWLQRDYPSWKDVSGLVGLYPFTEGEGDRVGNISSAGPQIFKPAVFHPLRKVILEWPSKRQWNRRSGYQDLAVNILGFIPLGFFFTLRLLRGGRPSFLRAALLTLFMGAGISLAVELSQVYLPGRNSQSSDLFFNILGTVAGVALVLLYKKEDGRGKMEEGSKDEKL